MKRKVQQLGSATLAVTVPAEWARTHNVQKGDEITVQQNNTGGSLLLVPEEPVTLDTEATIDADKLSGKSLERALVTQYVLGRQLIRIEGTEPLGLEHQDGVLAAERQLMGLSTVEQGEKYITVRCSIGPEDFDLPTLLERLGRTEASMREGALTALTEGDTDLARQIISRRHQVEKLFYLFRRLLFATHRKPRLSRTIGVNTGFPLISYRALVQNVLLMADTAHTIGTIVTDHDGEVPDAETADRLLSVSSELATAVERARTAVTNPTYENTQLARSAFDPIDDSLEAFQAYLSAERPEPLLVLQRVIDLLEQSARHAEDTLDIATSLALREDSALISMGTDDP